MLIKTDANGNESWKKTFGGTGEESARSILQTLDGGYIIAGYTESYGAGDYDAWLVKTDANGNESWNRTFGGTNFERAQALQQTSDGGFVLLCYAGASSHADLLNILLIKTDANGNESWNRTFWRNSCEIAMDFQQTHEGGYIIAGITAPSNVDSLRDILVIKTDANGNESWNKTFGGTGMDTVSSVIQTPDAGYVLAGCTASGNRDAWLIKTDANGNELWNKTFGGTGYDYATSVLQTAEGDYVFAGLTGSYGLGTNSAHDAWLVKVNEMESLTTIIIDDKNSEGWVDPYSSDSDDKEAVIWYDIEPANCSGELYLLIQDSEGNEYTWDEGSISVSGGKGSVTWNGKVDDVSVNETKNPYYITLVLEQVGIQVARSSKHRIWVGRPVILVHGFWSNPEMWNTMKSYLESEGFYVVNSSYAEPYSYIAGFSLSTNGDIKGYSKELSDEIETIRKETGAKKVDLVCHSMGGLVSRWYSTHGYKNDVAKLIMIGTPNHGSELCYVAHATLLVHIYGFSVGRAVEAAIGTAGRQMTPYSPFLNTLNYGAWYRPWGTDIINTAIYHERILIKII